MPDGVDHFHQFQLGTIHCETEARELVSALDPDLFHDPNDPGYKDNFINQVAQILAIDRDFYPELPIAVGNEVHGHRLAGSLISLARAGADLDPACEAGQRIKALYERNFDRIRKLAGEQYRAK